SGSANASKGQGTLDTVMDLVEQFDRSEVWRNAAVVMVTVPVTWFLTSIGAGLFGCLVVMAFVATYYKNAVTRFRYKVRDDIRRELILPTFETDLESVEWLNAFMSRFWLTFEPALSAMVVEQADAILAANTPGFVNSIRLTTFTLGSKAPRVEAVKTFGKDDPDVILMDWEASFTPNDTSDLTPSELENKVNPKIVLSIRLGKGVVGAAMPVMVEDMVFRGRLRLKLRLMPTLPLVKTVDASFLEPPTVDFVLKPIGGETLGFDVAHIPGLQSFIHEQINANIGPMMYAPNAFTVDVDALMNGASAVDTACGVFMITIRSARSLPNIDRLGTIDPMVRVNVNGQQGVLETPSKNNTLNPTFNLTAPVLLRNVTDQLEFEVLTGKKSISRGHFDLQQLQDEPFVHDQTLQLHRDNKPGGQLYWSGAYFPVATPIKDESGQELPVESNSGLLRFTVYQAHDLDTRWSSVGQYSPYVVAYLNNTQIFRTKTIKRSNKPMWGESMELFVADKDQAKLRFVVRDSRMKGDISVGEAPMMLDDALNRIKDQNTWFNLRQCNSGRLKLDFTWRPVLVDEDYTSADSDPAALPAIGVVKLNLIEAKGLRNVERIGESDPYVKVLIHNRLQGRTRVIDNNLNPSWNETFVIPVHRVNETVVLECMDFNKVEKDKTLGETFFQVRQLLGEEVEKGTYTLGHTLRAASSLRQHNGKMKGHLYYTAEFYPIIPVHPDAPITMYDPVRGVQLPAMHAPPRSPKAASTHSTQSPTASRFPIPSSSTPSPPIEGMATEPSTENVGSEARPAEAGTTASPNSRQMQMTRTNTDQSKSSDLEPGMKRSEAPHVDYSSYHAGILRVRVHEGRKLQQSVPAQVLLMLNDNDYNPCLRTALVKGTTGRKWDEMCQFATPELDHNVLTLSCVGNDDDDEVALGRWSCQVRDILTPEFLNVDDGVWLPLEQQTGELRVTFDFTPTEMDLLPQESITNTGVLRLEIVDAQGLPAADNSGTSDPYVVVALNGEKIHKTEAIKKTLSPVWHSTTDVPIMNRVISHLTFEIYDWNKIHNHTRLGLTDVALVSLPVNKLVVQFYEVCGTSARQSGRLRLRMLFTPQYINNAEEKISKMNAAESVVKAPIRMATGSAHLAGKAFGFGGHAVGGGARLLGSALGTLPGLSRLSGRNNKLVYHQEEEEQLNESSGVGAYVAEQIYPEPNEITSYLSIEQQQQKLGGELEEGQLAEGAFDKYRRTSTEVDSEGFLLGQVQATPKSPIVTQKPVAPTTSGAPPGESGLLYVSIIEAENLPGVDSNGLSDPYVRVRAHGKSVHKTRVQKKTVNPKWDEHFEVRLHGDSSDAISFIIKDHNTFHGNKEIWQKDINVWEYVHVAQPTTDFWVRTSEGALHLAFEYTSSSMASVGRGAKSPGGRSRGRSSVSHPSTMGTNSDTQEPLPNAPLTPSQAMAGNANHLRPTSPSGDHPKIFSHFQGIPTPNPTASPTPRDGSASRRATAATGLSSGGGGGGEALVPPAAPAQSPPLGSPQPASSVYGSRNASASRLNVATPNDADAASVSTQSKANTHSKFSLSKIRHRMF
ncbi:Tricalbin-2, partial [Dimargaris verticillata]